MKKTKKPFFAKFLEKQVKKDSQKNVKGGVWPPYDVTMKYPSDGDDYETH
ncbi:MAG: microviridin/marinostatin family tricyclic proteinase inhibitor [Flammeovirgaceae bacterium]